MIPILKIKDDKGNEIPIPAIKGEPGKDGADGKDYVLTDADKQEIVDEVVEIVGTGGGTAERPTETVFFENDWLEQANSDVSGMVSTSVGYMLMFKAIKDDAGDYANKEIAKIEYTFDYGETWVDVSDLVDSLSLLQISKSVSYNDGTHNTICFGSIYYPVAITNNPYVLEIQNQNQSGFRVTYYID